jgi:hypothetical protein
MANATQLRQMPTTDCRARQEEALILATQVDWGPHEAFRAGLDAVALIDAAVQHIDALGTYGCSAGLDRLGPSTRRGRHGQAAGDRACLDVGGCEDVAGVQVTDVAVPRHALDSFALKLTESMRMRNRYPQERVSVQCVDLQPARTRPPAALAALGAANQSPSSHLAATY